MRDPRTPATSPRRRVLLLAGLLAVLSACGSAPQSVLDPQGPLAEQPDTLFRVVVIIALVVFFIVQGLIVYAVVKFRDRGDETPEPEQVHGNTRLELVWTLIPALILAGIAVPTVQTVFDLAEEDPDALIVEVIGHRWWWEYVYPDSGVVTANELVIPVDTPVTLKMRAEEGGSAERGVLHSYWVPALAGKQDVAPGRITTLNMEASETGVFMGQCTEYCGLSHANMRNYATVLSQEDYDQWVEDQLADAPTPEPGSDAERGAELFVQQRDRADGTGQAACSSCHMINGEGGIIGPNLTHLMSREMFAGSIFDLYEREPGSQWGDWTDEPDVERLRAWIANAPAEKAMRPGDGVGMPQLDLTDDEVDALVAYLLTLE